MPVPPDIEHQLRSLTEMCMIGGDVEWYFLYVATDTVAVIDAFDHLPKGPKGRLAAMAEYLEDVYLRWRAAHPDIAPGVSYGAYDEFSGQIEKVVLHITAELLERGYESLTPLAIGHMRLCTLYDGLRGPLRRAGGRVRADTLGYDEEARTAALDICNTLFEAYQEREDVVMAAARTALGAPWDDGGQVGRDPKRARIEMKRGIREDRQKIKRSVKAAEEFLGADTVRLFVGGAHIRITGQRAIYEISKASKMLASHGSTSFAILDLDTKEKLCDLCVYTPKVPMLDHVLGLIFRIRAGCEDEILEVGNPYNIAEAARTIPWLIPHLDRLSPRDPGPPPEASDDDQYVSVEDVKRNLTIMNLRKEVAAFVFDDFGDLLPALPYTREGLMCGVTSAEYITHEILQQRAEENRRVDRDLNDFMAQLDSRKAPPQIIDL